MRKRAIMLASAFCMLACMPRSAVAVTVGPFVLFYDSGSTRIDSKASFVLDNFVSAWSQFGQGMVIVNAHADLVGSEESNRRLSCARAEAVRAYLVARGVPENRIRLVGLGESQPLVETLDGVPERNNRFVQLLFFPTDYEPEKGLC